ncbi:MAG: Oxygen-independent coproporphyrinogen-III oxidase 1 [Planctomycetota bacterium]
MQSPPRSVYIHVPFCLHHCGYCDFTVVANRNELIPQWLDCLRREMGHELAEYSLPIEVDTIFLGGGTPTHLAEDQLTALFELLAIYFRAAGNAEISIEANPDGLTAEKLQNLRGCGVNRISLGVQSFQHQELEILERTHRAIDGANAVCLAAEYISRVGVDLIFAVPGQSLATWENSLQTAVSLPLHHISTYGLTWEQGTAFFRREQRGQLQKAPEDVECRMYLNAIEFLTQNGFEHYEVSNFARIGCRCRHNLVYWHGEEYFAFGPGAARYVNGRRSTNCRSVFRWMKAWTGGQPCTEPDDFTAPDDRAREAVMLGLRLREGLALDQFRLKFGVSLEELAGPALERSLEKGLTELVGNQLRLTTAGLLIADSVVSDFLVDD